MMNIKMSNKFKKIIREAGVESLHSVGQTLPANILCEPPCSLKWMQLIHSLRLGAFSYAVSGYYFGCKIGRYVSIGENVQMGRQDHPTTWLSTSPIQYLNTKLFDVGEGFELSDHFHAYASPKFPVPATKFKPTVIGNDVWIGHGAYVRAGVTVSNGAIVAAHSVVVKDVPPYAVVAGNPAVVKKFRFSRDIIAELNDLKWWDYAFWDFKDINFHDIDLAIKQLGNLLPNIKKYDPKLVDFSKLGTN